MSPEAEAAFAAGKTFYARGDYMAALNKLQEAYDKSNQMKPLRWLVFTQKKLNRYTDLIASLPHLIEDPGPEVTAADRSDACDTFSKAVRSTGTVRFLATEADVTVSVGDGKPATIERLDVVRVDGDRPIEVRITKPGFKPFLWKGAVPSGQEIIIDATLKKDEEKAMLAVVAEEGAQIWLEGKSMGLTRWEGWRPAGPYSLMVTAPGKNPFKETLLLQEKTPRSVEVTLDPKIPTWVLVVGATVLAGSAAIACTQLFRSAPVYGTISPGVVDLGESR